MFKFFKLFGSQYFGFWAFGLLLFAVQEIPYMVMPLFKLQTNPIMNMAESSQFLEVLEKVFGSLCIAFMLFIVNKNSNVFLPAGKEKIFFALAVVVLLLNFIGWGIYFGGQQSVFVMMFFIVAMPPLFYFFIGLWRKNILLTVMAVPFLIIHFIHVFGNLKLKN